MNVRDIVKISLVWAPICTLNNATAAILHVFYKDLTVHVIGQTKANRSACYNAGAIFDSISSEPFEWKTPLSNLDMAEKSEKALSYFFKRRKQFEDESDKENTTTQVAHEDLNDVDDPTKKHCRQS